MIAIIAIMIDALLLDDEVVDVEPCDIGFLIRELKFLRNDMII
jgi:hypothetical protein